MSSTTTKTLPKKMGIARLYAYIASHQIDIIANNEDQLLDNISKQISNEVIEATPELLNIIDQVQAELIAQV